MIGQLQQVKYLCHETVVYEIKSKYGEEFTYCNDSGNLAIGKKSFD